MFIDILIVLILTTVWLDTNETHLSTSKVFRSNCLFLNLKSQTKTADKELCYYKPKTKHTVSLMITTSRSVDCKKIILLFGEILQFFFG